jgi:two-component system response regulator YesN
MANLLPIMEKNKGSRIESLVDTIKHHIKEEPTLSLSEIAKKCMISEPYMYASFKKATGKTPNDYRQKILSSRAVELLLTTDKTVEEIAEITSFSSASYMRRILKKLTGATPAEIRRKKGF